MTNTGMVRQGFGNDEPTAILEHRKRLYGTPRLQEIDQALLRLHGLMDSNQPVDVMLCTNEEVQMFLMAHPVGDRELSNVNIISYMVIKLFKCDGIYTKAIER